MSFSLTYNGLTIGTGSKYSIQEIDGLTGLDIFTDSNRLINRDGGVIYNQKFDARIINISLYIVDSNVDSFFQTTLNDLLNAYTKTDDNKELIITTWETTPTTKVLNAKVTQMPKPVLSAGKTTSTNQFIMQLYCENPFYRDQSGVSLLLSPGSSGGGVVPGTMDYTLGQTEGGSGVITNTGYRATYPDLVRINGPIENPVLTNTKNSKFIRITDNLLASEYIEIYRDSFGLNVIKNGVSNAFNSFSGEFFKIEQGANTLSYQASSGTGDCVITFRNEFLNIS